MSLSTTDKLIIGRYIKRAFNASFNFVRCYWTSFVSSGKKFLDANSMVRIFGDDELNKYFSKNGEKIAHDQFIDDKIAKEEALVYMNQILAMVKTDENMTKRMQSYMNWSFVDAKTRDIFQIDPSENVAYKLYDFSKKQIVHEQIPYSAAYFSAIPLERYIKQIDKNFITKIPEINARIYPLVQITEIEGGKVSFKDFDDWSDYITERFMKEVAGPRAMGREVNADLLDMKFLKIIVLPEVRKYLKDMTDDIRAGRKINLDLFYKQIKQKPTSFWTRAKNLAKAFSSGGAGELIRNKEGIKLALSNEYEDKIAFSKFLAEPPDYIDSFNTTQYLNGLKNLENIHKKLGAASISASAENKKLLINSAVEDATDLALGTALTNPEILSKIFIFGLSVMGAVGAFIYKKAFSNSSNILEKTVESLAEQAAENNKLMGQYLQQKIKKYKEVKDSDDIGVKIKAKKEAINAKNEFFLHRAINDNIIEITNEAINSTNETEKVINSKEKKLKNLKKVKAIEITDESPKFKIIQKMNRPIITEPDEDPGPINLFPNEDPSINNGEIIVDDDEMVSQIKSMIPFNPFKNINPFSSSTPNLPLVKLVRPLAERFFPFGTKVFDFASMLINGGKQLYDMYKKHKKRSRVEDLTDITEIEPRVEDITDIAPSVLDVPEPPLYPNITPSVLDTHQSPLGIDNSKKVPELEWGPPERIPVVSKKRKVRRTSKIKKLELDEEFFQIFYFIAVNQWYQENYIEN